MPDLTGCLHPRSVGRSYPQSVGRSTLGMCRQHCRQQVDTFVLTVAENMKFQLVFMIGKKAGTGLCPILMLCPMPKNKDKKTDKPTKKTISSAEDDYEDRILAIIENPDTANLKPEMEQLYRDLVERLPIESFKMAGGKCMKYL